MATTREEHVRQRIREEFDRTFEERVARFIEIEHQGVIAGEHFGPASAECLRIYRDGHFISTVMVTQAVADGLWRFILDRNAINAEGRERPEMAAFLVERQILTQEAADAAVRIWGSFRNDVHHMNPKVAKIPFPKLAQQNVTDLATLERELFDVTFDNGKMIPKQPKYWDLQPDGTAKVFLRDWWRE
jgi:hypothetical protein